MIVDEGHRLKNLECKLIKCLKGFNTQNRLLLTGTPLQNNLKELWSLLNFLLPDIFSSLDQFQSWFDFDERTIEKKDGQNALIRKEREHNIVSKLHEIIRPFVFRRLKKDVLGDLLRPKREYVCYTPLTNIQEEAYVSVLRRQVSKDFGPGVGPQSLQNMMMQLRKICNHLYLFQEPCNENGEFGTDERIIQSSGKMILLDTVLDRLDKNGHKVLIFSQMARVLDILEDYLIYKGHNGRYCRIDGSTHTRERQKSIKLFKSDPNMFCFLLSTRAGGLGINLTSADTVIIYDSDWNPHCDTQAQDRCHRIGQTKNVLVLRFITPNSVEVNMLQRATSKLKLEQLVINKGNFSSVERKKKQIKTNI